MDVFKTSESGTTLYCTRVGYSVHITNIDVEPGVKKVRLHDSNRSRSNYFNVRVNLSTVMKQFPDVEVLEIASNISNVNISNFMFPNVKEVISNNRHYVSGEMLVDNYKRLCNAFCRPDRDTIDLDGIASIKENALAGTHARHFINCKSLEASVDSKNILKGSPIQLNPSLLMLDDKVIIGHALFMINSESKHIHIPDDVYSISNDVNFKDVKMVSVSSMKHLNTFFRSLNSKILLFDTKERIDFHNLCGIASCEEIDVADKNPFYCLYNGIIYSKDKRNLIYCPANRDNYDIHDGTENIMDNAFTCAIIQEISIPDSVVEIGDNAFRNCFFLSSVKFGKNLKRIGVSAFSGCSISNIDIPESIKVIRHNAFAYNRAENVIVTLREGLEEIEDEAFYHNNLRTISIPKSVRHMGQLSLPRCIHDIYVSEDYPKNIISSFVNPSDNDNSGICCIHIENYGEVYVPMCLSQASVDFINLQFNLHHLNKEFTDSLYEYSTNTACRQNSAIFVYSKTKNNEIGKYLRRSGKSIVKRLISSDNDESTLIEFVKTGLMPEKTLKFTLDLANENDMSTVAAYILQQIGESEDTTSFRL